MNKQISLSALSDELAQVRTKKREFLAQIERIIPWSEWFGLIKPCYYKGERGNKPYPLELMVRLYLLQNLYNLSDEATVAEAIDSRAFSEFCGVDSSNQVPDGDTLGRFRNLLIKNGMQEKLFAHVVDLLQRKGLLKYSTWKGCTLRELQYFKEKGIRVMILEIPTTLVDYSSMENSMSSMLMETINNMLIEMYATFAHAEMQKREKRQREGIEAMRARGEWDKYGRPAVLDYKLFSREYKKVVSGQLKPFECMRKLGMTKPTFYRYRNKFLNEHQ